MSAKAYRGDLGPCLLWGMHKTGITPLISILPAKGSGWGPSHSCGESGSALGISNAPNLLCDLEKFSDAAVALSAESFGRVAPHPPVPELGRGGVGQS